MFNRKRLTRSLLGAALGAAVTFGSVATYYVQPIVAAEDQLTIRGSGDIHPADWTDWYVYVLTPAGIRNEMNYHYALIHEGKPAWCVEPYTDLDESNRGLANSWTANGYSPDPTTFTETQRLSLFTIASLGYRGLLSGNSSYEEKVQHYATQLGIWEALGYSWEWPDTAPMRDVRNAFNDLKNKVKEFNTPVSFNGATIEFNGYGQQNAITLTDSNNVLYNYVIRSCTSKLHANISGNQLILWIEEGAPDKGTIITEYGWSNGSSNIPFVYRKPNCQSFIKFSEPVDPLDVEVDYTVKPQTSSITIPKSLVQQSADKKLITTGLKGVGFSVFRKSNNTKVTGLKVSNGSEQNGNYVFSTTALNASMTLDGIEPGEYYLQETVQPAGFIPNTTKYEFKVVQGKTTWVSNFPQTIINEDDKSCFNKLDELNTHLEGAVMQILDGKGNVVDEWTTNGKTHCISGLPAGNYVYHEKSAPAGMVEAADIPFTMTASKEVISHDMVDEDTVIEKVDQLDQRVVGAQMQIEDANGNVVDSWTTGQQIVELPEDVEINEETTTVEWDGPMAMIPFGVEGSLEDEYHFTLTKLGLDESGYTAAPEEVCDITYADAQVLLEETMEKVKEAREAEELSDDDFKDMNSLLKDLEDAINNAEDVSSEVYALKTKMKELGWNKADPVSVYRLKVKRGSQVYFYQVDATGKELAHQASGLKIGQTYTLKEVEAAKGYQLAEPVQFEVTTTTEQIVMEDIQTKDVSISKLDVTNEQELEGADLKVVDKEGNVVDQWISADEPHIIPDLVVGDTYKLIEVSAPQGYYMAESIDFTILNDCMDVQHVDMYDSNIPTGDIRFHIKENFHEKIVKKIQTGLDDPATLMMIGGGAAVLVGAGAGLVLLRKKRR